MNKISLGYLLDRRESPYYCAIFRVVISCFLLVYLLFIMDSVLDLYGANGLMNWEANKPLIFKYSLRMDTLSQALSQFGLNEDQTVMLVFGAFMMCALLLLLGIGTRLVAVLAWTLNLLLYYTSRGTAYGLHSFMHISLFYLILMPSNRVIALDARLIRNYSRQSVRSITRNLLQVHMAIMYASSGLEKAVGEQWWNGEAIWRAVNMGHYMQYDMGWLAYYPVIPLIAGIGTLVVEIGYIIFMWIPRIRVIWLTSIILLHLFIIVFLGLHFFAVLLIILNLGAFGPEVYQDIKARTKRKKGARTATAEVKDKAHFV